MCRFLLTGENLMCFSEGDKVKVVSKGDKYKTNWVSHMDKFVNDGKTYVVSKGTDIDGECFVLTEENGDGDGWWFPVHTLKLAEGNKLLEKVSIVSTYRYNDINFHDKDELIQTITNDYFTRFVEDQKITTESIGEFIKDMENLKELCQKLK